MSQSPTEINPGHTGDVELRHALEQAGCRFTRQRSAVYHFLRSAHCHPTAEQVFHAVRHQIPKISLATVYKALETLVDAHLAAKLADATGPARYDCRTESHYHFRSSDTGEVRDLPVPFDRHLLV